MATTRSRRAKLSPKDEAAYFSSMFKDKDGFDVKYINSVKGRGVFSCCHFQKGDFLVEYRGEVITKQEYERRHRVYHRALEVFLFEFRFNGKQLWVDAAREDGSLGRLVNDDHMNPNSKMKTITVDRKPHLCLFAIKDISPGEEICYNYGDSDWPWRSKVTSETQQQSDALVSCLAAEDGTEKISSETDPQLRLNDNTQQISSETDPQLRLNDNAQQISTTSDPQLTLHDVQQVTSGMGTAVKCFGQLCTRGWKREGK
ncbi:N-lysine methyltransferase KMT5A-A-like isoform X2 [Ictalurus furcatus]|nr:N-lysine methyltransferase KMT5A-A-like isoform X2 [Ictalurus furcatus]